MKAWVVPKHGGNEVLVFQDLPNPSASSENQILVRVKAVGLNHLDLWVRNGVPGAKFPLPLIPGCDFSGMVENAPVGARFKKGDRVLINPILSCGLCQACVQKKFEPICPHFGLMGETQNGGCAEYVWVDPESLVLIPNQISFTDAACLPIAYMTAWSMLTRKANVLPGELVLVQAGGSGVSVAAIQMAKLLGATVVSTTRNPEKVEKIRKLGADHVILSKGISFKEEALAYCKLKIRKGFDVVLDHLGQDSFSESLRVLDWGGRLVICGATSGSKVEMDLKPVFFKNISILGSTMASKSDLNKVLELVEQNKIRTVVDSVMSMKDLPAAYEKLENRKVFGKICLSWDI
jgi:NADPH:quinone reductase-like Zn-dependent oxidoreductase